MIRRRVYTVLTHGNQVKTERVIRMTEDTYQAVVRQALASKVSMRVALGRIVALGVPAFEDTERVYRSTSQPADHR